MQNDAKLNEGVPNYNKISRQQKFRKLKLEKDKLYMGWSLYTFVLFFPDSNYVSKPEIISQTEGMFSSLYREYSLLKESE